MNPTRRCLCSRWLCTALLLTLPLGVACARNVEFDAREAEQDADNPEAVARESWPMYGGTNQRNMANTTDKNIPESWAVGGKNIKWAIDLGTESYSGPVIAGGKIFVGTNNGKPRDPKIGRQGRVDVLPRE